MPNQHVSFGKIVATPTSTSWSQAYHAGSLFAVLSLTTKESGEDKPLNALGKEVLNSLEAEFFTLEEKNLVTIKKALSDVIAVIPKTASASFCLAFAKNTTLYLFLLGGGKVMIKRKGIFGVLLEQEKHNEIIKSASGYLEEGDVVLLQTEQFVSLIPEATLREAIEQENPTDMTEALSPLVHGAEEGGAAAMFLSFPPQPSSERRRPAIDETSQPETTTLSEEEQGFAVVKRGLPSFPSLPSFHLSLPHRKKVVLSVAVVLIVVLVASIFLTIQNKEQAKIKVLFAEVYPVAQKQYDEGMGLKGLNSALAQDDFRKAKEILTARKGEFKPGTAQREQIDSLLSKVNAELEGTNNVKNVAVTETADSASPLLSGAKDNTDAKAVAEYKDAIYLLTADAVETITDGKNKTIIENKDDWSDATSLRVYAGNVYILDQKEGVLKYVAGSNGYGKSAYFSGDKPNLNSAVSMAIDSSVYILTSDGKIMKYTRGKADSFSISGTNPPLSSPTRIFTNPDTDNLYILDNGNGRLVKLSKEGSFLSEYRADQMKNAKEIDVHEKDKKAYFLSNSKIYEISL